MSHRIGVRDLKNRTSEIVREVHERDAESVVTLRGLPQRQGEEALEKLDKLAEQIARSWRSPKSAVELIEEQRR